VACLFRSIKVVALVLALVPVAVGQIAILQIQVLEGEGMVHAAGGHSTHPFSVAITDEGGRPVAGAAVSFHLPDTGPGGTFINGLRTDVAMTDSRGRAAVRAFQANRVPGRFQIRIVASKEQARAGTVSFQYVGELKNGPTASSSKSHRKWVVIAAAAGGGVLAAVMAGNSSAPKAVTAPPAPAPPPAVSIGVPAISVGKP
jgi:hypothetical protein